MWAHVHVNHYYQPANLAIPRTNQIFFRKSWQWDSIALVSMYARMHACINSTRGHTYGDPYCPPDLYPYKHSLTARVNTIYVYTKNHT